jgi:hypothetical protein
MKYQYNLTAIEPHKDEGLIEIHICNTESLEAVCNELLRYKSKKRKKTYPKERSRHDFSRDARFTREILIEEYKNKLGQIEEVWETDYDFVGNDDIYVATYCNGWRKFVRDLIKEQS